MNIALVYDRVNKYGGAERVLEALHTIWPEAPLFTAVYDKSRARWADVFRVRPSFLNSIPGAKQYHEFLPVLTPLAFESFSFDSFDVVISITSADAKYIITKPGTVHICYCLTPTRYLWSGFDDYINYTGLGIFSRLSSFVLTRSVKSLRLWDVLASKRPDHYIAISDIVKKRIETYYNRTVEDIIYPPVDIRKFALTTATNMKQPPFYLTVSRFVGYKRVDIIVDAFTQMKLPLVVIGDGWEKHTLTNRAGRNIRFIHDRLTDGRLVDYYKSCTAFVFAGSEDFGLVAAEAQAAGKAVIAYAKSGVAEIVRDGKTGILFDTQSSGALIDAVRTFERMRINPDTCRENARRFSLETFQKRFYDTVRRLADAQT